MPRRPAALAMSTVLLLVALFAVPASAATSAPLPKTMAAVGDSITQAASTGGSLGAAYPANSWSTGTNTTVNSHYLRLKAAGAPITAAYNVSSNAGAKVEHLPAQMVSAAQYAPDYLTVLIGGNDLCTSTFAGMTSVEAFERDFTAAMHEIKTRSSKTYVYVTSIPDVYQLWSLFRNNYWARLVWSAGGICQSLLANAGSNQAADVERRAAVRQRNIDFNAKLKAICESPAFVAQCRFDGNAVFNTKFVSSDVSADYFHPSTAGQAKLASVSWNAGYSWTQAPPTNQPPTASFSFSCTGLTCAFTDASTDTGGSIVSRSWTFGDNTGSAATNPTKTYTAAGAYSVTLTVTDNGGATGSTSQTVTVSEPANTPPTASFTHSCSGLTCVFTDASTDAGGSIVSRSWTFGDNTGSAATNPTKTYTAAGAYTVTLTVTDNGGLTATQATTVSVSAPPATGLQLQVAAYKVKGTKAADLSWSGATSASVDVFRDGVKVATTANSGAYTDNIGQKGGGTHYYKVCEAGTANCSGEVSASY